jgi:hypothetical protein
MQVKLVKETVFKRGSVKDGKQRAGAQIRAFLLGEFGGYGGVQGGYRQGVRWWLLVRSFLRGALTRAALLSRFVPLERRSQLAPSVRP